MSLFSIRSLVFLWALLCTTICSDAFVLSSSSKRNTQLSAFSRRDVFGVVVSTGAALAVGGSPAEATYSAYVAREKDWEERSGKGEIQFSTAKSLRAQLREIAPMNSEGSKVFCPNGPSAAVSPLMENRCSDTLAMPSVYGRSDDVLGNSIPGIQKSSTTTSSSSSIAAQIGGFPKY